MLQTALNEATQAQAEAARVRNQSRAWARVREEEARADRSEAAREAALRRADELKAQLAQRSTGRQIEHQELLRLRGRVKELVAKVATYDARSNRRFFDVDPLQEENEGLRQEHAQLEQTAREQLAAAQSAADERLAAAEKAATERIAVVEAEAARLRAVAEPPKKKFFEGGHYTSEVDLTALEMITLGVSANVVPMLFVIFGRFYGVKIPSRTKKVLQPGTAADGKRIYEWKDVLYIPGKTHIKELPAIGNELHAMQVGQWLLEDPEASYCYVADAANSQQREILAQLLFRRNKQTGKLESMAMSIDEISDKTSVGQQKKFKSALASIAEAWGEAAELGALDDGWQPLSEAEEAAAEEPSTAADFFEQQRTGWRVGQKRKIAELTPASATNDRAAPARKAARLSRGGDGSGGSSDVQDDPTCAHHAVANVGEEGRKAIDKILKAKMAITEEQAESDASKVKALRTSVGWFSSPACSLIYQCSKYVALFSCKGYAIGANFATWLAHKLKTTEQLAGELIGHVEDLLAICGGRDYVFFLDAAVVDRFSQLESLYGYLLEEADMGAEAGGKLRKAILTGFESVYCMAAVRSMAVIADAWLWPMLRAIEPGDEVHILDVCPQLWPRTCAWLEEAAASPQSAIDGTLNLRMSLEAANLRTTPRKGPTAGSKRRAERAAIDLQRVRAAIESDAELKALVHDMLSAAFTAMAASVRNHASEFMPGGCCCTANITPELRTRLDGMPLTSVGAETMFARVKRRAERGGISRHDTRMGGVLCERDGTVAWARGQTSAEDLLRLAAKRWRKGSGARTIADEDALKGEAKAPEREAKLAKKRSGRAAKAAEVERLKDVEIVSTYSALKKMGNESLSDQLKIYKKLEKKSGFKTTGSGSEMRLQLQSLIFEKFGVGANDLADGDSGLEGRAANDGKRRARKVVAAGGGGGKKKKKKTKMVSLNEWEWEADEVFDIERLIGKMVADGGEVPGRTGVAAGTVLYKVLWKGFPPDIATWESEEDLAHTDEVQLYEAGLVEEEEAEEEEAEEGEADTGH